MPIRYEATNALRLFLEESGYTLYKEHGSTIDIIFDTGYLIIITWYNPELAVTVAPGHKTSTYIPLSDPDSFDKIIAAIEANRIAAIEANRRVKD
jgi:hypothetical protein